MIIIFIISIFITIVIGYIEFYNQIRITKRSILFAIEYQKKFRELSVYYSRKIVVTEQVYHDLYTWLTKNVTKIQHLIGEFGIINTYSEPFSSYIHHNYELIVNTLPKFRSPNIDEQAVVYVDDCLIRYIGYKEEQLKITKERRKNPCILFITGIKEILALPLRIILWFEIFDKRTFNKAKESLSFKIMSVFISLCVLLSAIVTIIIGWEQVINIFKKHFN